MNTRHMERAVSEHYARDDLLDSIRSALEQTGRSVEGLQPDDLATVDEFHIGGRAATQALIGRLGLAATDHVLDVGCGIGGPARYVAAARGCRVTGIDLTEDYVRAGNALCEWVGLQDRVTLVAGSALSMPFEDARFDGAYMMHVGMNIADKAQLFRQVHRVLRPGAVFGVYDVMRERPGDLAFPVPWASEASTSRLATREDYRQALSSAGFEWVDERDCRGVATDFFQALRARMASGAPPALGLHLVMKDSAPAKIRNMIANFEDGLITPVEIIVRKAV